MSTVLHLGHHRLHIEPERALWWPAQQCVLLADVHVGKADTFRRHGIAIPDPVQQHDLARLQRLLQRCQPQRLLILGDLVHGAVFNPSTQQAWVQLVQTYPGTRFELVAGNHDRWLHPQDWQLYAVHPDVTLDDVHLSHEPVPASTLAAQGAAWNIHGHIHPAVHVPGGPHKLPALVHTPPYVSLPAFSAFTGGATQDLRRSAVWLFLPHDAGVAALKTLPPSP